MRVLLVDDDEDVRGALVPVLESLSVEVSVSHDGDQAFERLRESSFELVVCDLRMPGRDGFEICGWLHKERPSTRVVVISGHLTPEDQASLSQTGARLLPKPFGARQFKQAIQDALSDGAEGGE